LLKGFWRTMSSNLLLRWFLSFPSTGLIVTMSLGLSISCIA